MNVLKYFVSLFVFTFFTSSTPNLFGSRKRRKAKEKLSKKFYGYADEVQDEIEELKLENPFESAAAKAAMTQSARKAKQTEQRFANLLGGRATPEALIAAQGQTQEAIGSTAGDIATGAEAIKQQRMAGLRGERMGLLGQAAGIEQSALSEYGSGWRDFFAVSGKIGSAGEGAVKGAK